ncbi:acyl-CoA-binding protein homolog, partial [Nilaparvata lugens]|uniref:acyl-CoA-binding protein homolog n=1 Tax=Nilaparvata lugens TaxID=108931 RepID=UPI00193DACC2
FRRSSSRVRDLTQKPNDDELLELYGLFKQATEGDNTTGLVYILHFFVCYIIIKLVNKTKLKSSTKEDKWDAWTARKGLSNEEAKNEYVAKVKQLMTKYEHS